MQKIHRQQVEDLILQRFVDWLIMTLTCNVSVAHDFHFLLKKDVKKLSLALANFSWKKFIMFPSR